ncbi:MAG: FtsX-like permease family protein [Erysipelotrichaceae bacterium]|nr:FtsX-like permease family protein [Erysipelotrichaceae bacterium]
MVKRKSAYWKNLIKSILSSKARFLSIFAIVLLGAAFYSGLRNTPGTMALTMDNYLDNHQYSDLIYRASLGFSLDDLDALSDIEGIEDIAYVNEFDAQITIGNKLSGVTVYSNDAYSEDMINAPELLEGTWPEESDECLIDNELYKSGLDIGDEIVLTNDYGEKTFVVVGIIDDVRYVAKTERGTNTLGDGTNSGFIEILTQDNEFLANPDSLYELRDEDVLYNEILIVVEGASDYNVFSTAYDEYIEEVNTKIKSTLSSRMSDLYEDLTSDVQSQLDEATETYNEGYEAYTTSKDAFDEQILEAKIELTNAKITLAENELTYLNALSTASDEMGDSIDTVQQTMEELQKQLADLQTQLDDYNTVSIPSSVTTTTNEVTTTITNSANQILESTSDTSATNSETIIAQAQTIIEQAQKASEDANIDSDAIIEQANKIIDAASQEEVDSAAISEAANQIIQETSSTVTQTTSSIPSTADLSEIISSLDTQITSINQMLGELNTSMDGISELMEASIQIENAKLQIENAENELTLQELQGNNQLEEAEKELEDAKTQLDDAQAQIDEIPKGKVYTLTKNENAGLVSFDANVDAIEAIAEVFPLIFFLVSALVSLTTMTRMVEEQRSQNGTLRALGYSKFDVIMQYVVYVLLATSFACIFGILSGNQIFTRIIWYLYNLMMFQIESPTVIQQAYTITLQAIFISVFVVMFATLYVSIRELNLMPAVLMRPKAPKLGKRIFLERIGFIWKRMNFNQKVTMRNIFRYKQRFFMSVIGIAGCTALIITGFGIKYSVSEIVDRQYGEILVYDADIRLEDDISVSDSKKYATNLLERDEVTNVEYVYEQSCNVLKNKEDLYATMIVYQSLDNITNFINFKDYQSSKKIALNDDGVVLSQKTAELLDVEVGDTFDLEVDDMTYNVKVEAIMENYSTNYVFMSQDYYEELTSSTLIINHGFLNMKTDNQSDKTSLENYMSEHSYGNLSYLSESGSEFADQMSSLDIITIILTVCAGALNFIVLYNLTNINIQERKSEIATIKVLGFRRNEVYDYIFRENIILSAIGSFIGIFLGIIIHRFIVLTVEFDSMMFVRSIHWTSYVYAVAITIGFTYLIDLFMRPVLNKVDMVESLKSIE